jgi:hypothetical protein
MKTHLLVLGAATLTLGCFGACDDDRPDDGDDELAASVVLDDYHCDLEDIRHHEPECGYYWDVNNGWQLYPWVDPYAGGYPPAGAYPSPPLGAHAAPKKLPRNPDVRRPNGPVRVRVYRTPSRVRR